MREFSKWNAAYLDGEVFDLPCPSFNFDLGSEALCIELASLFEKLEALENMNKREGGESLRYWFYFRLPAGDASSYAEAYGYEENEMDKAEEGFKRSYPRKWYWYELFLMKDVYRDDTYYYIWIGNNIVLRVFDGKGKREKRDCPLIDECEWLEPISSLIDSLLQSIKDGTYCPFVQKHLDYRLRKGYIKYRDYWTIYPSEGKRHFAEYKGIDISRFAGYIESGKMEQRQATHFSTLTVNQYCHYYKIACDALCLRSDPNWTLQEHYCHNTYGGSSGLERIDGDSIEAFDKWYEEWEGHFDHAFEMAYYKGGTCLDLRVHKDEQGYYLCLTCDPQNHAGMRVFLALAEQGIYAEMYDPLNYLATYNGDDDLTINKDYYRINFPTKRIRAFIEAVTWEDIPMPKLKNSR